jgi:hypothetical protein
MKKQAKTLAKADAAEAMIAWIKELVHE